MKEKIVPVGGKLWCLVSALLLLTAAGCSPSFIQKDTGTNIEVVTTIFPLSDIVEKLGAGRVKATALLLPGASPHTYEPTVEQAKAVANADLFIFVGAGLDDWITGLAEAENIPTLEIMAHMGEWVLEYNLVHADEESDNEHAQGEEQESQFRHHHQGSCDPHIWMDPVLVKEVIAPLITEKLTSADPESAEHFAASLEKYQAELEELHEEILTVVGNFPKKRFISYHSAWNYFAHRYGLEEVAAVETFPGKEPSAKWLAELIHLAGEQQIDVLFAEPQLSKKTTEIIAREIGGKVSILDPLGGKGVPGRESYTDIIRYNLEIFRNALE